MKSTTEYSQRLVLTLLYIKGTEVNNKGQTKQFYMKQNVLKLLRDIQSSSGGIVLTIKPSRK